MMYSRVRTLTDDLRDYETRQTWLAKLYRDDDELRTEIIEASMSGINGTIK